MPRFAVPPRSAVGRAALLLALHVAAVSGRSAGADGATAPPPPHRHVLPYGLRGRDAPPSARGWVVARQGLRWLAGQQQPDGRWKGDAPSGSMDPGVTGLVLLAFLGAAHAPVEGDPYRAELERGLTYLVGRMDADGYVGRSADERWIYSHGFATAALVEAAAVTGDALLAERAQRALAASAVARNPYFAWRYGVKPGDNDTSVTGCLWWGFQAAAEAQRATHALGLPDLFDLEALPEVEEGVEAWLDKMTDPDYGRVGYIQRGQGPSRPKDQADRFPADASESMTAIAVWFGVLTGRLKATLDRSQGLLLKVSPLWSPDYGKIDLTYWMYGAMALARLKPPAKAQPWYDALEKALTAGAQAAAGGSRWPPEDAWVVRAGWVASTSLAVLALEGRTRFAGPPEPAGLATAAARPDADPGLKARALGALALRRAPQTAEAAAKALGHADAVVRRAALAALESVGPRAPQAAALATATGDAHPVVAAGAARLLGSLPPSPATVAALTRALGNANADVRAGALDALGPALADPVLRQAAEKAASESDARLALAAARALAHLGAGPEAALTQARAALAGADLALRLRALRTLQELGTAASGLAAAVEPLLSAEDHDVRLQAALALAAVRGGPAGPRAPFWADPRTAPDRVHADDLERAVPGPEVSALAPALARALSHPVQAVRLAAARALGRLGREARAALPALETAALSAEAALAAAAVDALPAVRGTAPPSRPAPALPADVAALREALRTPAGYVALRGAALSDRAASAPRLAGLLGDAEAPVRLRAAELLGDLGPGPHAQPAALLAVAATPEPEVRVAVLGALERSKAGEPARGAFAQAGASADADVRRAGLRGLAALNDPPMDLAPLVEAAASPEDPLALAALAALVRWEAGLGPEAWQRVIETSTQGERSLARAKAALEAASRLAPAAWPVLDALVDRVRGGSRAPVRDAALQALESIGTRDPQAAALGVARWSATQGEAHNRAELVVQASARHSAPHLLPLLPGPNAEQCREILRLFSQETLAENLPQVLGRVDAKSNEVRFVLGWQLDTPAGIAALARALRAPEREVRLSAALAAGQIVDSLSWRREKAKAAPLLDALARAEALETEADVRAAIVAARGEWKPR